MGGDIGFRGDVTLQFTTRRRGQTFSNRVYKTVWAPSLQETGVYREKSFSDLVTEAWFRCTEDFLTLGTQRYLSSDTALHRGGYMGGHGEVS